MCYGAGADICLRSLRVSRGGEPAYRQPCRHGEVENQPSGSHVGSVSAVDRDAPPRDRFVYVIDSPMTSLLRGFRVDAESGQIVTTKPLDREMQDVYSLTLIARATVNQSSPVYRHLSIIHGLTQLSAAPPTTSNSLTVTVSCQLAFVNRGVPKGGV